MTNEVFVALIAVGGVIVGGLFSLFASLLVGAQQRRYQRADDALNYQRQKAQVWRDDRRQAHASLLAAQGLPARIGWLVGGLRALTNPDLSASERRERGRAINDHIQDDVVALYSMQVNVQLFASVEAATASQPVHGHLSKFQSDVSTLIQEFCAGPADLDAAHQLDDAVASRVAEMVTSPTYIDDQANYVLAARWDLGTDATETPSTVSDSTRALGVLEASPKSRPRDHH